MKFHATNIPMPSAFDLPVKTLADIDKLLIVADTTLDRGRRSAAIIGQAFMQIMEAHPEIGMRYLEGRYRALGSATFLLGAPQSDRPPGTRSVSFHKPHKKTPYWLWICVNGAAEAAATARRFGIIDEADNLRRLDQCGWIVAKS